MAPTELLTITPTVPFTHLKPRSSVGNYTRCMERILTSRFPAKKWSLGDLSTEVLSIIFKNLRDLDIRSLATARLLSRRIDAIITPIKFEYLRLTEDIISPQGEVYHARALQYVYTYTRHIEARSDLDPERIRYTLDKIDRLLSIRWRYVRSDLLAGSFWLPSDILSPRHSRARLYISDLPLRDPLDGTPHDAYLRAIPPHALVSLKMAHPAPPLVARLEPLKRLLVACPRLETFHYRDRGQGGRFVFAPGERLPPLVELSLRSYDWDHGPDAARAHWDFSRLRRLALVDVPVRAFLAAAVPAAPGLAARLEALRCEDAGARDATPELRALVGGGAALRELRLVCRAREFLPAETLLPHAAALRSLSLRDHVGFGDEERPCPTLAAAEVALLARRLGRLRELELDWDAAACDDPEGFLAALCAFPRLAALVLHTQTVVRPLLEDEEGDREGGGDGDGTAVDRDYEAAVRTFALLVRGKQSQHSSVPVPWRSITINVGGWRHAMVRRTGAPWRERNLRGVYAERCFVLERGEDGGGEMVMREEMALDT